MCDHEPTADTAEVESKLLTGAHLAIVDGHFADRNQHAFGHGSQEHAAELARQHPDTLVLAAHHGPMSTDDDIRRSHDTHREGLDNFRLAVEGMNLTWDGESNSFR